MNKEFLIREAEHVHFLKLMPWSWYIRGARDMLLRLREHHLCEEPHPNLQFKPKAEDKIYNKAFLDLIMESKDNVDRFLLEDYILRYTDFGRDKKGRLIKCRAYFAKKVVKYEEI